MDTSPIAGTPFAAPSSETTPSVWARVLDLLCAALAAGLVARLWIAPMRSSLWLDEFGTWWVTNGRFAEILPRVRIFPQSLLYAVVIWLTRAAAGTSELALRAPSLLAAILLVWAIWRLGEELVDRETGLLAACIVVPFPLIVQAAHDARPYAMAVLAAAVATRMLVRWARRGRGLDAGGYVGAASAVVYLQYFFATVLPAHAAWLWPRIFTRDRSRLRYAIVAAGSVAILTAPAVLLVLEIGRTASRHSHLSPPDLRALVDMLLPQRVLGPLLIGVAAALVATRFRFATFRRPETKNALALLILWMLVPIVLLASIAWITGIGVFAGRYLMSIVPAQALLLAWLVRGIPSAAGRRAALALYLAIVLVGRGLHPETVFEDWRDAAAAVRAANHGRPVLLDGGLIESRDTALLRDPIHAAYLRAPLDYYDAGGTVALLPLRRQNDPEKDAYAEALFRRTELDGGFALIERTSQRFASWSSWLEERARERGLVMRKVWDGERMKAWVCEKGNALSH